MKKLIEDALKETGLDYYYLKRPKNVFPCLVYQYNELPNALGDNTEECTRYDVYINLIIKNNLTETTEKVKEAMKKHRFMKVIINAPIMFDELDYYQITFNYTKSKSNN